MLEYPKIDPIAISLGPLDIHWYGLAYLFGFLSAYLLMVHRAKQPHSIWSPEQVADITFYGALGVMIGGRLGSALFYNLSYYIEHPLEIIMLHRGGMSFHGGFIGVIVAIGLYCRKRAHVFDLLDFGAPMVPIGLGLGRLGNFINGELWGRVTDSPLGMVFPKGGPDPRHPSQLYQACLEGLVLFLVLWFFTRKPRPRYVTSGLFCVLYGSFRFIVEFFRQPDAHLNFILWDWVTMGQLLSLPMIAAGAALMVYGYKKNIYPKPAPVETEQVNTSNTKTNNKKAPKTSSKKNRKPAKKA